MTFKIIWLILSLLFINKFTHAQYTRNLTVEIAPGCSGYQCNLNVYYIKGIGYNDTIHYLWDFTKIPSLLLAHSDVNTSLQIDWKRFLANSAKSVKFSSTPNYLFTLQLTELIEYDDPNDQGLISNDSKNRTYRADKMQWVNSKKPINDSDIVYFEMAGTNFDDDNLTLSGSVIFKMSAFGTDDHDLPLPRLLHSANSSQANLILKGLSTNSGFEHSRWALKFIIVSSDIKNQTLEVDSRKNVNDENSPGVFTLVDIMTPNSREGSITDGAFLNWRPVVYTTTTPSIANSSDVGVMEPNPVNGSDLANTLAYKVFGDTVNQHLADDVIVSFGSSQDGFYSKTNYSSWTFLVSYGSPQIEGFSWLVIMVMSIGLGLPFLLILFGGLFVCVRRCRSSRINEM